MGSTRHASRFGLWGVILGCLLISACSRIPPLADLNPALWDEYKQVFVSPDGRVIDTGNHDVSHSEGQGYGMMLAVAANDRATFDLLWSWTRDHLKREHDALFSYRWDGTQTPAIQDKNNASDGELLIAWALARAYERWQAEAYREGALQLAQAIRSQLLRPSSIGTILLPGIEGFEHPNHVLLNPSYWIFPAFRALDRIDPSPEWKQLEKSGLKLLKQARFGQAKLTPDWVRLLNNGQFELDPTLSSRFSYDALRIPLYSCWAHVENQDLLNSIVEQWRSVDHPAWVNLKTGETAPYALSPSQLSMRRFLLACIARSASQAEPPAQLIIKGDYYSSTLALLGEIALQERRR